MNSLKLARYFVRRYVPIIGTTTGLRIVNMVTGYRAIKVSSFDKEYWKWTTFKIEKY